MFEQIARSVRMGLLASAIALSGCGGEPVAVGDGGPPLGDRLPIDEQLALPGLHGWVDAVRDEQGRMHIYASDLHDAMLVQGYLMARDRQLQVDLLRRIATGRLAEVLGGLDASVVETDIAFRHVGLHRVAAQMLAQAEPEVREAVEAYAAGVSLLFAEIREGRRPLPKGLHGFEPAHFTPFTAVDSLSIARFQTWLLSYSGDDDLALTALLADLKDAFRADDPDPLLRKRAGMERDYLRFEPAVPVAIAPSLEALGTTPAVHPAEGARPDRALSEAARRHHDALDRVRRWLAPSGAFGSNNWAIAPSRSASGYALLASDPHLALSSPAVFWPVSIHVSHASAPERDLQVGGVAFAGIPGIILGHNEHLAWGATVANHDVSDVYLEKLTPSGDGVIFRGQEVPFETVSERIDDGRGGEIVYEVKIVPHHGPIFPTVKNGTIVAPEQSALSLRWTGLEATGELSAVLRLHRARDVGEALSALRGFEVGGQNWMIADTNGNIGWTSHARVPERAPQALAWSPASYEGLLPCFVLPGDGSAEWTGFWPAEAVPWARDPLAGFLASANGDPIGTTFDNDPSNDLRPDGGPAFLECGRGYAEGFRQGRIVERIGAGSPLSRDDMASIQGDHHSPLGRLLTPALLLAIENAQDQKLKGGHPELAAVVADPAYDPQRISDIAADLAAWGAEADYLAATGIDLASGDSLPLESVEGRAARATLVFNAWLVRFLGRTFGDELARIGRPNGTGEYVSALLHLMTTDPAELATYDPASGDSALFDDLDTPEIESRQEQMIRALLDASSWLESAAGDFESWRWGRHHQVSFAPLVPIFGAHAIPGSWHPVFTKGFPRPGDMYVVDAAHYDVTRGRDEAPSFGFGSGATQRFVIELDPSRLRVRNVLPGGAVADPDSPHFADQAEAWRKNEAYEVPFVLAEVIAAAKSRTVFSP